jgi:hypothetical protein
LIAQEFKGKAYNFKIDLKHKIFSNIMTWFPSYEKEKEIVKIPMEEISRELFTTRLKLPHGSLEIIKVHYGIDEETMKDIIGTGKNIFTIEKFPDPLTQTEKEEMIKLKEDKIREKEINLKRSMKIVEDKKNTEEIKMKELEVFLEILPYSLDDIFEYTKKEILDSEKDLISIFAYLEKDDYRMFKKLWEIYQDYAKFYENDENYEHDVSIDILAMMHFFLTYFDLSKKENHSFIDDFKKYHIDKLEHSHEYNFQDFIFTIIYILYNLQVLNNLSIEKELMTVYMIHDNRLKDSAFYSMFRDDMTVLIINRNIEFLKNLFQKYSNSKFKEYHEMNTQQYLGLCKEVATGNNIDFLLLIKDRKFNDGKGFFDFIEALVHMSINIDDTDSDLPAKLDSLVSMIRMTIHDIKN